MSDQTFRVEMKREATTDGRTIWVLDVGGFQIASIYAPHPDTYTPQEAFRLLLRKVLDQPVYVIAYPEEER